VEKRSPSYDLNSIKAAAAEDQIEMTVTARRSAAALGFDVAGMVITIQTIERRHFVKSMTSLANHRVWQDVYNVPSRIGVLYVKFTGGVVAEFLLLSFKER
jgi:motility quorum-sensing regulator/GCU-specific mRNA interferase toxin